MAKRGVAHLVLLSAFVGQFFIGGFGYIAVDIEYIRIGVFLVKNIVVLYFFVFIEQVAVGGYVTPFIVVVFVVYISHRVYNRQRFRKL